jgi:methylase of polypeptide subunit release factors
MTAVDTAAGTSTGASAAAPPPRWATEPFVMGTPEQFARLRAWFADVGYTEPELLAKGKVDSLAKLKALEFNRAELSRPTDPQSLLVLLFVDGSRLPWHTVRSIFSPGEMALLTDLGLLQPAVSDPQCCVAPIALYPDENLFVASDRLSGMETIGKGTPADLVFSPLTRETRQFIRLMPRTPCDAYLEMCAGTGIAALLAAKQFARHATAADITERSTRFARFNAALNALDNFSAVQGDLYAPVADQTFDMISAHPPYVPAQETQMVFRDGGADGEQITRRILGGLAEHLRPGGLFYLDCVVTDRAGEKIEERLRRMLGPDEDEFDVIVVRHGETPAKEFVSSRLTEGRMSPEAAVRQAEFFKRGGIERLVGITGLMQRRTSARAVVTRQHASTGHATADDILWLMRYHSTVVSWGREETDRLLDSRIRALPGMELHTKSVLQGDAWVQQSTAIGTNTPFGASAPCPPWFPSLLVRCDGQRTAREHLAWLREQGLLPMSTSDSDFAVLLRELADVPFLELDAFPLPARKPRSSIGVA